MTADPKQLLFHLCIGRGLLDIDIAHSKRKVCTTRIFTDKMNIGGGWVSTASLKPLPSLWFQSHLPLQTPCVQRQIHRMSWNKKRNSSKATRDLSSKASLNVPLCATGLRGKISVEQPHGCLPYHLGWKANTNTCDTPCFSRALHSLQCISEFLWSCIQAMSQGAAHDPWEHCPCPQGALQPCCAAGSVLPAPLLHCSTQLQHWQRRGCSEHRPVQSDQPCLGAALVTHTNLAEASFPMKCNRVTTAVSDQEL